VAKYKQEVQDGHFPGPDHTFEMPAEELEKFRK
jgi:ketopantoate hydroxymethyltransferase